MHEQLLVRLCAPTLAGMKTGSLFRCPAPDRQTLLRMLRGWNAALAEKGLCILPLGEKQGGALLYLFRPKLLERDLRAPGAACLLAERGYCVGEAGMYLAQLVRRLKADAEFPHEIGLFLSYPPEDVRGFIAHSANRSDGCKLVGTWRVYGDVDAAKKTFEKYRKCTESYCRQWSDGVPLVRLAVTA